MKKSFTNLFIFCKGPYKCWKGDISIWPGFWTKSDYSAQCCSIQTATQSYTATNVTLLTSSSTNRPPPPNNNTNTSPTTPLLPTSKVAQTTTTLTTSQNGIS